MAKHFLILKIIILSTNVALCMGESKPEPEIARTYSIGIIADENNCIQKSQMKLFEISTAMLWMILGAQYTILSLIF